jgi:hypothetical protein
VILAFILFGYIVLGCLMDQIAILILTVPIVLPLIKALGFDPVWFGVIVIVVAEVGLVTPPVGLNVFVVSRYAKRPLQEIFAGVWPHVFSHLLLLVGAGRVSLDHPLAAGADGALTAHRFTQKGSTPCSSSSPRPRWPSPPSSRSAPRRRRRRPRSRSPIRSRSGTTCRSTSPRR